MKVDDSFDVIIVGSGFGGSVMAYRCAQAGLSVCLLERGRAYPPGSFARTPAQMRLNFWNPSEGGLGLFNVWSFPGIESVVSAGLGGGSLIYANVLLRKDEHWFVHEDVAHGGFEYWPVSRADLDPHYDEVEKILKPQTYPVHAEPYASTPKMRAYQDAAQAEGLAWSLPPLAVTFANEGAPARPGEVIMGPDGAPQKNLHGVQRTTCRLVAECDIGCQHGSKNSLDFNYLTLAKDLGADIRVLTEVRSIRPKPEVGYEVDFVQHSPDQQGSKVATSGLPIKQLAAKRLVLAAGTFGSTFLLLKNQGEFPGLSPTLGSRFCGNGDLLGFIRNPSDGRDLNPMFGPVITSTIRVPDQAEGGDGRGYYIQEGGFPLMLGWILEAADAPGNTRRAVGFLLRQIEAAIRHSPKSDLAGELKLVLGDAKTSSGLMVLLGMGRDVPNGRMSLRDGWLQLDWKLDASAGYFDRVRKTMGGVAAQMGADFTVNPLWYLRKLISVHGLGGCPMGRDPSEGVVDSYGEVFSHPGLFVADGSVMPGPVGANPSLTIAALADRFAERVIG